MVHTRQHWGETMTTSQQQSHSSLDAYMAVESHPHARTGVLMDEAGDIGDASAEGVESHVEFMLHSPLGDGVSVDAIEEENLDLDGLNAQAHGVRVQEEFSLPRTPAPTTTTTKFLATSVTKISSTAKPKRAKMVSEKSKRRYKDGSPLRSAAYNERGRSISLARRAAATAKKRRDATRVQLALRGLGSGEVQGVIERTAAIRSNVSQYRGKRAQRVKWTQREVNALKRGVTKFGVGRWAVILRELADEFEPTRISVDLKDKWRNISEPRTSSGKEEAAI